MLALFSATAAYPQAKPVTAYTELFGFWLMQPLTPQSRIELVRRIEMHCRQVLDTVPTNTPAEDAWIDRELKLSNDLDRINRALNSREFARYQLKASFSDCLKRIHLLQQAQTRGVRTTEAAEFVRLASGFDPDYSLAAYAKLIGLKPELPDDDINTFRKRLISVALRVLEFDDSAVTPITGEQQRGR